MKKIKSLVPVLRKSDFDDVATEFLQKYCPEALKKPMPVPIESIAKKMGLFVCKDYRLTEDFSVYGMICFSNGIVDIYDKDEDAYEEKIFKRGTILIDPDTILKRRIGCFNNTVAHECVHWFKHRNFHLCNLGNKDGVAAVSKHFATRKEGYYKSKWSDEDWMEWQAEGIAPRILMPKKTFIAAAKYFKKIPSLLPMVGNTPCITYRLADFFKVSCQSANIRMKELNIPIL